MKRKVCVITGTRAEYGLLSGLMKEIDSDPDLQLEIIATCMHLSGEFGLTYKEIEEDGFRIDKKIEILLSSDSPIGISKSMGLACIGLCEAYSELEPDIVILLGDRFEVLCAASTACVARIPVAHIHGGEITQGAMDEAFRHAVTKMSHLHFTSTEEYRRRVIQLGEDPDRVFNVGALGIENIRRFNLLSKDALEKEINFSLGDKSILVTFHPVTLEPGTTGVQFQSLLGAIDSMESLQIIFTKANADTEGRTVNRMIDDYVSRNAHKAIGFASMGQLRYLSAMKHVSAVVGNSSSGIIEAPSLKTPTLNIGDRQKGRVKTESVIDCEAKEESIKKALLRVLAPEFSERTSLGKNPYEKENSAVQVKEVVKRFELKGIIKKEFYDLPL